MSEDFSDVDVPAVDKYAGQTKHTEFKVAARTSNNTPYIEWKDSENLRRFLTPNGKIQGRKKTSLTAREQRMLAQAIKRARYMGLLPYTSATM